MNNETDNAPLEVMAPSAIQSMERAQIDAQVATAHAFPRSIEQFKKRSLAMATLDLETSESCIYCRPVGKEKNEKGQWVEKFAEGPSIRLAEIVACCYGNLRAAARVVEQTPRQVKAEGACHDLETNYAGKSDCVESTVKQNGEPSSERQAALVAKIACAKAYRDAIFRVVPRALCKPAFEAAKKIVSGEGKTIGDRVKRVQKWLEQRKIDDKRALAVLGITDWSQVTEDHLMTLTGLRTAVQDGDDPGEIFPFLDGQQQGRPEPTGLQQAQHATTTISQVAKQAVEQKQAASTTATQTLSAAQQAEAATEARKKGPGRPKKEPEPETKAETKPLPRKTGEKFTAAEAAEMRAKGETVDPSAVEGETPAPTTGTPGEPPKNEDADLAAMGLAPEPEKPAEAPAEPAKPEFQPVPGEGPEITNLRRCMFASGIDEDTVMAFATDNKLAMGEKSLKDFVQNGRANKLVQLAGAWPNPVFQAKLKTYAK